MNGDYSDIIDLPHHVSSTRPHMSRLNRAAQFAPFAALTGYGEAIEEAARLTDRRIELGEEEQDELNRKLARLARRLPTEAELTWFVPDAKKDGGRYVTQCVAVRQILPETAQLVLADGRRIDLDCVIDVMDVESPGDEAPT